MNSLASAKTAPEERDRELTRLQAKNRELARTLQMVEKVRANLADHYDFAPIGFVTLSEGGCILEINLTGAQLLGRERPRLLTMPFFPMVAKPHRTAFLRHFRECRRQEGEAVVELVLRSFDDREIPVELRTVPVLDGRLEDTVYRMAVTDITERLRVGYALRASEERYRTLVELLPDGIFVLSEGKILFATRAASQLCGLISSQELAGHDLVDWICPAHRQRVRDLLLDAGAGLHTLPVEVEFARRDGKVVVVEVTARAFMDQGKAAVQVVARDISQRKEAERQVLAISESERTSFGRDLHDSLLQTLTGAALLLEVVRNRLSEIAPECASEVERISGILRQSAVDARNLANGLCPVTIAKMGLVAALEELTEEVSQRTTASCVLEYDPLPPIRDVALATHVYRIAQEAIGNASKHGKASSIRIQLRAVKDALILSVQDDGKGISATLSSGSLAESGKGMGMHTMRYRATIIGGSLEVRPFHPRGTLVTCTFPMPGGAPL